MPEDVRVIAAGTQESKDYVATLDEEGRDALRKQVRLAADDLNDEWRLINSLGLEK